MVANIKMLKMLTLDQKSLYFCHFGKLCVECHGVLSVPNGWGLHRILEERTRDSEERSSTGHRIVRLFLEERTRILKCGERSTTGH